MKSFCILLLVICTVSVANAQSPKEKLLSLLKSKHDYERMRSLKAKDANKEKYDKSYALIKQDKKNIISYIDSALKTDAPALSKKFIDYEYNNPLSSRMNLENIISQLTYFKIVKYSLENSKVILPPISEVGSVH